MRTGIYKTGRSEMKESYMRIGTVKGGRRQGRQRKRWENNIRVWTGLEVRQVPKVIGEQVKMEKTGCKIICDAPTTLAVKGLLMMMMR